MSRIYAALVVLSGVFSLGSAVMVEAQEATDTAPQQAENLLLKTDSFSWKISPSGKNLSFIDLSTGVDYMQADPASYFAQVIQGGKPYLPETVRLEQGLLFLSFPAIAVELAIAVKRLDRHLLFEVLSLEGEVDELLFSQIDLRLAGLPEEDFAACALALNLKTNVSEIPGPAKRLRAMAYSRFGFVGAKVAVLAVPQAQLRVLMKEVVQAAEELPHAKNGEHIGGPWALDAEISRGSYLFDFGKLTEETVDEWIVFAKSLGLNQIDFHTGKSLRFGDYRPDPDLFPRGMASLKAVIDKLHEADMYAGLHTYACFIAKDTPYVTPVPDARLGKDAQFTLAQGLDATQTSVMVKETTEEMSTKTGFFARNSVTLHIDDELINYSAIDKEPPYAFRKCERGAFGTTAAPHDAGATVYHLKSCFNLFCPDGDSTLLTEIAANTARAYNECGFDMIYLDALDGSNVLEGNEWAWYYGSKFVFDLAERLERPALFEMSTFHHHLWYVRARMGAWDHPSRSHKRYIDLHCEANHQGRGMFLPMNLGWWAVKTWDTANPITVEPTFPDDIEYLMGKCLGYDFGISLMGVDPDNIGSIPAYQRLAPIFKHYETLRRSNYFSEAMKQKLRVAGDEYHLEEDEEGGWTFRPVAYTKHKVIEADPRTQSWQVENGFAAQPLRVRIEVLMSVADYADPQGVILEDFKDSNALDIRESAKGITAALSHVPEGYEEGIGSGVLTATNRSDSPVGSWTKLGRTYEPLLSIPKREALGLWVHGDGQGEVLNIQLRSPEYTTAGGIGDHYIPIDFEGWRYIELAEMEGHAIKNYSWPYGGMYAIYRERVDYGKIEHFSLWYNKLPPGKEVRCLMSPIKALPLKPGALRNPSLTIGEKTIRFPATINSGSYLEYEGSGKAFLYGPKGELLEEIQAEGATPLLQAASNRIAFGFDPSEGRPARLLVTVIGHGEQLEDVAAQ